MPAPGDTLSGVERQASPLTLDEDNRVLLAQWASDCAERVLPLFESEHPDDPRPRAAIAGARAWSRGEIDARAAQLLALDAQEAARRRPVPPGRPAASPSWAATPGTPPPTPWRQSPSRCRTTMRRWTGNCSGNATTSLRRRMRWCSAPPTADTASQRRVRALTARRRTLGLTTMSRGEVNEQHHRSRRADEAFRYDPGP